MSESDQPGHSGGTRPGQLPGGIAIREFRFPDDYEAVVDLWRHAGSGIHLRRSDERPEIAKKQQRDPELFLVAEGERAVIGAVLGGFDGRRGIVYHLAVAEPFRSQGVGSALMEELESRLRAKGCLRAYLMVTPENETAFRFYHVRGWERMELFVLGKDIA